MMRLAINGLFQANGGCLKNLRHLLRCWEPAVRLGQFDYTIYASPHTARALGDAEPLRSRITILPEAGRSWMGRKYAEQVLLRRHLHRDRPDVLLCPANTAPSRSPVPTVVVFQNAAPFSRDAGLRRLGPKLWVRFNLLRHQMLRTATKADHLVFGSDHFRRLFLASSGLDASATSVVPRAVDRDLTDRPIAPAGPGSRFDSRFLLCTSYLYPYKNILELIAAFDHLSREAELQDVRLVFAGGASVCGRYHRQVQQAIAASAFPDRIELLGSISANEVRWLLDRCAAFVFPSTCENCPTALMEALTAQVPIVSSNLSSMPEVAGPAALYFDPYNPLQIADQVRRVLTQPALAEQLRRRARDRSALMDDHQATADHMFAILRQTAAWPSVAAAA